MTPPDATALRALADRIEAAEGPDRELDAALQWHLVGRHLETDARWRPMFDRDAASAWDKVMGRGWRENDEPVPRLTGSLDAAVALVDYHGFGWQVDRDEGCTLSDADDCHDIAKAATPPLSVCLALCRALLARADAGQGDGA